MRSLFFLSLLLLLITSANGQSFTDSNLPVIIIQTDTDPNTGQPLEIPDEPKVPGNMKIIFRQDGSRNYVSDQNNEEHLNYNGRIGIEIRGSSSQLLPKKPYGLTTLEDDDQSNNNVSLLGLPQENDWVLNSLAYDPTLVRDYLSYELSRAIGQYASRGVYCEVMINGEYMGLYVLMEKLKVDADRIDVVKMEDTDNAPPEVTGGYVIKADKTNGKDPVAWQMVSNNPYGTPVDYIFDHPKPNNATPQQHDYIHNRFTTFQNLMTAQNQSIVDGYPSVIDLPSFIDFMIINELAGNVDAYQFSTYFHQDRNGKLRAGPVWDFNLTFGNDLWWGAGYGRGKTDVWFFDDSANNGSAFWLDLYEDDVFKCHLSRRWQELTAKNQPLHYDIITQSIDEITSRIAEAAGREKSTWNAIGSQQDSIAAMKSWLQQRMAWMNQQLNDYSSCENPKTPALVISKIHYHPQATEQHDQKDLEFIKITNHSNQTIDLTGIYFRELGLTYQFPANSSTGPQQPIFLASNAAVFEQVHGFAPFGQFTRNLSNKSEDLVLVDAYGNIIDRVEYHDSDPWPEQADGNGPYLQLVSLSADNNVGSNWIATDEELSMNEKGFDNVATIFPNPATTNLSVQSELKVSSYEISDLEGRIIKRETVESNSFSINIQPLSQNAYILKLTFSDGTSESQKFIKT